MVKVTIGMPVFNDIDFIEQSIESILDQNFQDFKLIISDDGATDGSSEICLKYASLDTRIQYIRQQKNLGISKNMQFLLGKAKSEYFMWAADDDLWHKDFLEKTVSLLDSNPKAIVAFSKYTLIDEGNNLLKTISNPSYSKKNPFQRLKALIKTSDDGFGYALFRRNQILKVKFPVWWWINKKTPYNNIYPTLCFYLSNGNYLEYTKQSLFFKRIKTQFNTNHKIIGQGNAFLETFAYMLRRYNLVVFSSREIRKNGDFLLSLKIYPFLFYQWFVVSSFKQIKLAAKSFYNNRFVNK